MIKRTTIRLSADLLTQAKRRAALEGRTLSSIIEDGLRRAIAETVPDPRGARTLPPISKVVGGPAPGVDHTNLAALQQMDDLDYVERMNRYE